MQRQGLLGRMCPLWIVCVCVSVVAGGCEKQLEVPHIPDDEIDDMRISILWLGSIDKPVPEVIFIVDKKASTNAMSDYFRPVVIISREEARSILDVLVPIYEKNEELRDKDGYIADIRTLQRHLEFRVGPDRKSQTAALTAISASVGAEGRSALAPMIAYGTR